MRHVLLVLLLCACDATKLRSTESLVRVDAALRLPTVWVGETAGATLEITAFGSGPVTVLRLDSDGPIVLRHEGMHIAAGTSLPVRVEWTPGAAGTLQAGIRVETDAEGDAGRTVSVTGEARAEPGCDDGNPCTDDRFDRRTERCVRSFHGRSCDDDSACTVDDRCRDGVCVGVARDCDDDNVCTLDFCNPATGCEHPPDGRRCDDGDPCTTDVCDPDDGCTHPDAPDGTSCGAFSCSTAHVCVFGGCRTLDVTGLSDGFPCFDNDLCTEGDLCRAGSCAPGPRVHAAPEVLARFETFGGEGSLPATDGSRYLFADRDALRVAVRGSNGLQHTATLALVSRVPPLVRGAGRFLVAHSDQLALVDAYDAAVPAIVWNVPAAPVPGLAGELRAMVAADGGILVVTDSTAHGAPGSEVLVHIAMGPDGRRGQAVSLMNLRGFRDLAADGTSVAWTDASGASFVELETGPDGGKRLVRPVFLGDAARVAVAGRTVALARAGQIDVIRMGTGVFPAPEPCRGVRSEGGCSFLAPACGGPQFPAGVYHRCGEDDAHSELECSPGFRCEYLLAATEGTPCPDCDDCCCPGQHVAVCVSDSGPLALASIPVAGVRDVALDGGALFWAEPRGIFTLPVDTTPAFVDPPDRMMLDALPATRLDAAPGHLLASGPLALPLVRGAQGTDLHRLTGERHGDVVAAVDGLTSEVILGGPSVVARLDLAERRFSAWTLTPTVSGPERPRILQGVSRDAAVETEFRAAAPGAAAPGAPVCEGSSAVLTDGTGVETERFFCGLESGTLDAGGGLLWSATAVLDERTGMAADVPARAAPALRAWALRAYAPNPVLERPTGAAFPGVPWRVRAADQGDLAALSVLDFGGVLSTHVELWRPGAGTPRGIVQMPTPDAIRFSERDAVAVDGGFVLAGHDGGADLYEPGALVPRASVALPGTGRVRVPWMAGGRAWLAAVGEQDNLPSDLLYEVAYDPAGNVSIAGSLATPGAVRRVLDLGVATIVTVPSGVEVVRPACR